MNKEIEKLAWDYTDDEDQWVELVSQAREIQKRTGISADAAVDLATDYINCD